MSPLERLAADFNGAGLTVGRHPMAHRRSQLPGVLRAIDLQQARHNHWVCVAGCVIVRQRPGTAKGFVFLTLEDETGISNIIVEPRTFERFREVLTGPSFLLIDGVVQHQDGVIHVKARRVRPLTEGAAATSHDFH
jgi:error-prone DNA polymerase